MPKTKTRYDLLCIEGISRALRVFLDKDVAPQYKLVYPPEGKHLLTVTCSPEVRLSHLVYLEISGL